MPPAQFEGGLDLVLQAVFQDRLEGIRSLELRPLESAETGEEVSAKSDARQASGKRAAHAGIEAICRCRRVEIAWQRRLVQAVVARAELVDPVRARSIDPIPSDDLRPGVNLRPPPILQFRKIFDRAGVVPEEII